MSELDEVAQWKSSGIGAGLEGESYTSRRESISAFERSDSSWRSDAGAGVGS